MRKRDVGTENRIRTSGAGIDASLGLALWSFRIA